MIINLKTLSSEGKIAYLIKPILKVLQEAGGQLERSEIKDCIADMDDQIAECSVLIISTKYDIIFHINNVRRVLYENNFLHYNS